MAETFCTCVCKWKMRPVETILGMGEGMGGMMEVVKSTMIYCKNFCKCHNVPQVQ
jgi:hypothetical protein